MPSTIDLTRSPNASGRNWHNPHHVLQRKKTKLVGIRKDIARLLSKEQETLRIIHEQERILNATCKIHNLHDEILFHTFQLLVEDYKEGRLPYVALYPWVLTTVCQRWRNICLHHSTLWSHINLQSADDHDCRVNDYNTPAVFRTLLQLERSKEAPLGIHLSTLCDCAGLISRFRAVAAHASRWEVISVQSKFVKQGAAVEYLQNLLPKDSKFPKLQSLLWVSATVDPINQIILAMLDNNPTPTPCPALKSIAISGRLMSLLSDPGRIVRLPWEQLTHLRLPNYNRDPHILLTILSSSQTLTNLHLSLSPPGSINDLILDRDTADTVTLPHLRRLQFTAIPGGSILSPHIIQYLYVPRLDGLRVSGLDTDDAVKAVLDLIKRSRASLHILQITNAFPGNRTTPRLDPLLKDCPDLLTFTLTNDKYRRQSENERQKLEEDTRIIQGLFLDKDSKGLCPSLKKLVLDKVNVDPTVLAQVLDPRMRGGEATSDKPLSVSKRDILPLERLRWMFPRMQFNGEDDLRAYKFCTTLLKQKYSASRLHLELSLAEPDSGA